MLHEHEGEDRIWPVKRESVSTAYGSEQGMWSYASLNHAGVQPFIKNPGPSVFSAFPIICIAPYQVNLYSTGWRDIKHTCDFPFTAAALCSLLFTTSAGAHTVVATVPAAREAIMWIGKPSFRLSAGVDNNLFFAAAYLD